MNIHPVSTCFLIALTVLPCAAAYANTNTGEVRDRIQEAGCSSYVKNALAEWQVSDEWKRTNPDLDQGKIFQAPTSQFGTWVEIAFYPTGATEVRRFNSSTRVELSWSGANCVPQLKVIPGGEGAKVAGDILSDAALEKRISAPGAKGIVYAWSPHMPLSVQGLEEARQLADQLHLQFLPVLDPAADLGLARSVARSHHWGNEALRQNHSIELLARGTNLHYPALVVFAHGKLVNGMYPGWGPPANVEKYIAENLK